MNNLHTFGLLFETLAIRDLRVYADALMGEVRHYHDASGLECDAVVCLRDGTYGLVEIKIGGQQLIEKDAGTVPVRPSGESKEIFRLSLGCL